MRDSTILVVPDAHVPFHDPRALDLVLEVVDHRRPTLTWCLGDWAEQRAASRHMRRPGDPPTDFEAELQVVRSEWARLEKASRRQLRLTSGNHDIRYARRISEKLPELDCDSTCPSLHTLYGIHPSVPVYPYEQVVHYGPVGFVHDVGPSGKGASWDASAAAEQCLVQGHTHRAEMIYDGALDGNRRFVMTAGWLGNSHHPVFAYAKPTVRRHWQHGFGWIRIVDGIAHASFCAIVEGVTMVEGKRYGRRARQKGYGK